MEELISSYDLNFPKFNDLLKKHKAIISGSSVLSIHLDNMFVPNDIDIWIPLGFRRDGAFNFASYYKEAFEAISLPFYKFLWKSDFEEKELKSHKEKSEIVTHKNTDLTGKNSYEDTPIGIRYIHRVIEFQNDSKKKIQLIFIKAIDPLEFIDKFFDLSVCKTWFNPETNTIQTSDKENTLKKLMYISYDCSYENLHPKNQGRVDKYKERGFTLIENPHIESLKEKKKIYPFTKKHEIVVEDIIAFDSYNLVEFLKMNKDNIVIKSNENYQAWDRETYISECERFEFKVVKGEYNYSYYKTPLLQTIGYYSGLNFFEESFRIFEIVKSENTIVKNGELHNIHNVIPLSIKEFEKKYTSDENKYI